MEHTESNASLKLTKPRQAITWATCIALALAMPVATGMDPVAIVTGDADDASVLLDSKLAKTLTKTDPVPTAGSGDGSGVANDDFAASIAVPTLPYTNSQSTTGATLEPDEPRPCGFIGGTVWYHFTAVADESITIDTFGSTYDTVLAAYTGSAVNALSLIACNDDAGGTLQSQVSLSASAGTTYRIQVGGYSESTGPLVLNIQGFSPPANDAFADSTPIPALPHSTSQSTVGATTEADEPAPCGIIGSTVWFHYTPATDGSIILDTFGSGYDTVLAAYTGDTLTTLSLVGCNDDGSGTLQSMINFPVTAGTTYRIQAGGYSGDAGPLVLNGDVFTPPPNDDRADAFVIGALPYTNEQPTVGATREPGEPTPCGGIDATVWYHYTADLPQLVVVNTFGSNFDTVLAAYVELNGSLVLLACNDDTGGLQSQVQFPTLPGLTVYLQVGGYYGETGSLVLTAQGIP